MAKKESLEEMRKRMRSQAAGAHIAPEPETPAKSETPETAPKPPAPAKKPTTSKTVAAQPKTQPQRRRRSKWDNPYPDAEAFQTSTYLTEEDIVLIKSLRLRLHYAREWMVIKYALEKLDNELKAQGK